MYFEDYRNDPEKLQKLVVDYRPQPGFKAGVSLVETEHPEYPGFIARTMTIYFAPEQYLSIYMGGKMYASQKIDRKEIGVDTACYLIEVDGRYEDIKTGGDGYWGDYQVNILRWRSHPISWNRAMESVIESQSSDGGSHDPCRGSQ